MFLVDINSLLARFKQGQLSLRYAQLMEFKHGLLQEMTRRKQMAGQISARWHLTGCVDMVDRWCPVVLLFSVFLRRSCQSTAGGEGGSCSVCLTLFFSWALALFFLGFFFLHFLK